MNQYFFETSLWDFNVSSPLKKSYTPNMGPATNQTTEFSLFDNDLFDAAPLPQIKNYMDDGAQVAEHLQVDNEDYQWRYPSKKVKNELGNATLYRQNSLDLPQLSRQGSARQAYSAQLSTPFDSIEVQPSPDSVMIKQETTTTAPVVRALSFRKNSLKFCRRLSKSMLTLLSDHDNELHNTMFAAFSRLLETQTRSQRVFIRDTNAFDKMHRVILSKIWNKYRNIFSNYKNNKICLVTFDEWQHVFSAAGFNKEFDSISTCKKEIKAAIDFRDESDITLFYEFYKKLLLTLNRLLANLVFFEEMMQDEEFTEKTSNAEDFALMINSPWIYRHYNHSKGRFALECCNRCKICRSGTLPSNFAEQLAEAREKMSIKLRFGSLSRLGVGLEETENEIINLFSTLLMASN